jgi:hypothetical protein
MSSTLIKPRMLSCDAAIQQNSKLEASGINFNPPQRLLDPCLSSKKKYNALNS